MIARIIVAALLVLLVAAPAQALAGSVQIEIVEEPSPTPDDEAVAPRPSAHDASRARAVHLPLSEQPAPALRALARIFRPPRPALA